MASNTPMTDWLYEASRYIYYEPDRRRVRRELQEHLDDAALALHEEGLDWDSAKRKAVEAMGDPKEVGLMLRRVHKPWLGWVYKLCKWFCAACLALCLIFLVNNVATGIRDEYEYLHREVPTGAELVDYPSFEPFSGTYLNLVPSGEVECGDYSFQVTEAILASHPDWEQDKLCFVLSWRSPRFWLGEPLVGDALYAVDSSGIEYPIYRHYPNDPYAFTEAQLTVTNIQHLVDDPMYGEYFQTYFSSLARGEWVLSLPVEAGTEWVDIIYDFDRSFDIRIDLRKGGGST